MGYACPVCGDPQADARHLANHLAFTAMTSGGDHEAWLDERVDDWGQLGEAELADEVAADAEETAFPQVFEDTTEDHGDDHEHHTDASDLPAGADRDRRTLADADEDVLAEARELTRRMYEEDDDESETE